MIDAVDDYLSPSQAARALGLSVQRVQALTRGGQLPCTWTPIGRLIRRVDVAALARQRAEQPGGRRAPASA